MRHSLLAALLLAPLYAPLPAAAQEATLRETPRERGYWYLGLGVGTGSITSSREVRVPGTWQGSSVQATDMGVGSLQLRLGVALTQRLLLGVELIHAGGWGPPGRWYSDSSAVLTWFPSGPGPFLRAGIGAAGSNAGQTSLGQRVGGGYAHRLARSFELSGAVDYLMLRRASLGGEPEGAGALLFSLGLDWI